jgi:hypothetical protein
MQSKPMNLTKTSWIVCLGLLLGAPLGCQKEEEPPPLPTAKPAPTPSTLQLVVDDKEDAGKKEDEPKKKGSGHGTRRGPLSACCAALRQNAANLPEPSKGYTVTAAAACEAANGSGSPAGAFLGTLTGLLRGAPLPPACH